MGVGCDIQCVAIRTLRFRITKQIVVGMPQFGVTIRVVPLQASRVLQVLERTAGPLEKSMLLKALGRLGAPGAVRPLSALLADRSEKNVHLKRSCMAALAAIGEARGVRAITAALSSDDVYLRQGAAAVLEELAGTSFDYDPLKSPEENRAALDKVEAWGASKFGKSWQE